jgi:hypothetical protein
LTLLVSRFPGIRSARAVLVPGRPETRRYLGHPADYAALKNGHQLNRDHLAGQACDAADDVLAAVAYNSADCSMH